RGDQELPQLLHARRALPGAEYEKGATLLAVKRIRHRDQLGIGRGGMAADEGLHFLAADLLAAAIDVVAGAALEGVTNLAFDHVGAHHVARAEEAVGGEAHAV